MQMSLTLVWCTEPWFDRVSVFQAEQQAPEFRTLSLSHTRAHTATQLGNNEAVCSQGAVAHPHLIMQKIPLATTERRALRHSVCLHHVAQRCCLRCHFLLDLVRDAQTE